MHSECRFSASSQLAASHVTRNAEIDPGDNDPPPKMTQGVMTPPNPPSSPSTASLSGPQGVGIATLFFAIFFAIFLRPTEQICPDSAGPFHSFDPVGFAIFAASLG